MKSYNLRWRIFFLLILSFLVFFVIPGFLSADNDPDVHKSIWSVLDFGAKGDGVTDDTAAFQVALDAAGKGELGGVVAVPRGTYFFSGHLVIPTNVTLRGVWHAPTAWSQYKGTTLLATEGEGAANGAPFITLNTNSVIKGVTIFYPNQIVANPPKEYPWTIASGGGDNCSIIDVLIVNPYQAVDFGTNPAGRHYIRNLYAQPMYKGLFIDKCFDVGRVENVHFWPFWTCNNPAMKSIENFIAAQGESFIFGRTDWEYVYNTFSWGYKIGYHFVRTEQGVCNGNFLGIGADATNNAVVVDDCAPYGLLITNGEFVSFLDPEPTYILVKPENTGVIQFQNCAFWGGAYQIASLSGSGTTSFNNCNFSFWGFSTTNIPGIECFSGNLLVNSSNFNRPGYHIKLHKNVETAVITSNRFAGATNIVNEAEGDVQIGLNTQVKEISEDDIPGVIVIDNFDPEPEFRLEGTWYQGIGGRDYKGITLWAYKGKGQSKAYWTPDILKAGTYQVYVWYGGNPTGDHATDAPYTIKHKTGEDVVKVNLAENFGQWNLLGEFEFEKGRAGYVMTSNDANHQVVADAIKFIRTKKPKKFILF